MKILGSKKRKFIIVSILLLLCLFSLLGVKIYEKHQLLNAVVDIRSSTDCVALYTGETYQIEAYAENKKFSQNIVYKGDNSNIGEVSNKGVFTGLNVGKTSVKIGIEGSKYYKTLKFDVKEHVYKIKREKINDFEVGKSIQLSAYDETMKTDKVKDLQWSTSDESIAKIDSNGKIEGVKAGKVNVYLSKNKNKVDSITVNVKEPIVLVNDIIISNSQPINMQVGDVLQLKTTISPKNATSRTLNYSSSNKKIVDINQKGMMTAKKSGKVEITVTSEDKNAKKSIQVNVKEKAHTYTNQTHTNQPYINQALLKNAGIDQTSQLMIVAHPDDETLWGGGHLSEGNWFVVCLTNGNNKTRANEYRKVLNHLGVKGIILSYPDLTNRKRDNWKTVKGNMMQDLQTVIQYKHWDMIATHNPEGEYGHIHHKMTSANVTQITQQLNQFSQLYYFGTFYKPDAIPSEVQVNLSQAQIDRKRSALNLYTSQLTAINKKWAQMIPYEYWRKASE